MATILGCLGEGSELGIEAKVCELSDQALGPEPDFGNDDLCADILNAGDRP
jgi:hypothetical protein